MTVHDMQDDPDSVHFLGPFEDSGTRPASLRVTGPVTAGDFVHVRGQRGVTLQYRVEGEVTVDGDWQTVHLAYVPIH